jgi:hypothetical protein
MIRTTILCGPPSAVINSTEGHKHGGYCLRKTTRIIDAGATSTMRFSELEVYLRAIPGQDHKKVAPPQPAMSKCTATAIRVIEQLPGH